MELFYEVPILDCCFLSCTQVSQETGKVLWYSYFFKSFSQFVVIHTVKDFSTVNEADVFLELSCFFYDPVVESGNWKSLSSTLCDPRTIQSIDFSRPENWSWVAFLFSRGSSQPRNQTQVSRIAGGFFYQLSHKGSPWILAIWSLVLLPFLYPACITGSSQFM